MSDGIHIWHKGERWLVTRGNYTLDEFSSEQQAIQLGKQRARSSRSTLFLHADDGSVRPVDDGDNSRSRRKDRRVSA